MAGKRWLCAAAALFFLCLTGCVSADRREITCADIVTAYEETGYEVFHADTTTEDREYGCEVKAENRETGEYIFFHFFDTEEAAQAYAKDHQWNAVIWLYSAACGDPTWLNVKTYGNLEYEYADSALLRPFRELTR